MMVHQNMLFLTMVIERREKNTVYWWIFDCSKSTKYSATIKIQNGIVIEKTGDHDHACKLNERIGAYVGDSTNLPEEKKNAIDYTEEMQDEIEGIVITNLDLRPTKI